MPRYERLRLSDCTTLITTGCSPSVLGLRYQETGIKFVRAEALTELGNIDASRLKFVDEPTYNRVPRSALRYGDVVVTVSYARKIKSAVVAESDLPANVNENVAVVRVNPHLLSPFFLHYYITAAATHVSSDDIFSSRFGKHRTVERLEAGEILLPTNSAQTRLIANLVTCDRDIEASIFVIDEAEANLRLSLDRWFGNIPTHKEAGERRKETQGSNGQLHQSNPTTLDDIAKSLKNSVIAERSLLILPGRVLEWHHGRLTAMAETASGRSRKIGLLAMPGDIILTSAKANEYYVASALLDCIAPQASMVLRPLNERYVFLCLHTLLSPAFIRHATRVAVETNNRRPQWKFVRKYKIGIPSGEYLENANSSLSASYAKWSERVRVHIALRQKRNDLLAEFWKKLHQ